MRRLGLSFVRYFDHPNIPKGRVTRPHVLYELDLAGPERGSKRGRGAKNRPGAQDTD